MDQPAYMLDTNIFNKVLDGEISLRQFAGRLLIATGVQKAELSATKCARRRKDLLFVFDYDIAPQVVLASSFCFDIQGAGWGEAEWNDGSGRFAKMEAHLTCLDQKRGGHQKEKGNRLMKNQVRDIVIAETSIKAGAFLISDDKNLRQVVKEFGGNALSLDEMTSLVAAEANE
jgi:predicted nucleic acid-binding protein